MIVSKIFDDQNGYFGPDLSSVNLDLYDYESHLNEDGQTYTIKLIWKSEVPFSISQLQGKLQLDLLGLYAQVENMIEQSGSQAQIYWKSAANWERNSPILARLAPMIWPDNTDAKLDEFFINAKKLN
jgi:hypothetical protein